MRFADERIKHNEGIKYVVPTNTDKNISTQYFYNLIFGKINEYEINIFIDIINNINDKLCTNVTPNSVNIMNILYNFRTEIKNYIDTIKKTRSLKTMKNVQYIIYHMNKQQNQQTDMNFKIEKYIKECREQFLKEYQKLATKKENFAKDIANDLEKVWTPIMKDIYLQSFNNDNENILYYFVQLLARGDVQNISKESEILCDIVRFDKQRRNTMYYKSVTFILLYNEIKCHFL